jgi:2-methylcitrate dehydratase PrpD
LQLRKKHTIDWRQIAGIEFRLPAAVQRASHDDPQTGVEGKFSLGYCLCRALINGRIRINDFTDESVKDPTTRQLMSKITWLSEQPDQIGPFGFQEIILKMNDSNTYSCRVDHPRGEPQNPLTSEEFASKYRDCALHAHYDETMVSRIKDMVLNLEKIEDITQLTALIGK